ncbi:hypothetical protein Bca52824_075028 [Brassica carinata]|uniref:F-box associated beta-propeller type 1 domain-containing protein n=1 Tax=Brassica carinata TaxID=52824 RepID=A0A8X7TW05_BRACI|nr:hypothetical protein Bca52824_075028 [Brassica carinata]
MKWKFTIDSQRFKERHLIRRKQLRGPDVLILNLCYEDHEDLDYDRTFVFGSSIAWTFKFPITCSMFCYGSCDGLICVFCMFEPRVNGFMECPIPRLGFGRDKLRGTYKPVWLYNSSGFVPKVVTHCEVFDFSTNTWRYVHGSLYWFTACEEPMVLSFVLHTETFQVICKAPFAHPCDPHLLTMCILDNRLCVSERKENTQARHGRQCVRLTSTQFLLGGVLTSLLPIANLDKGRILPQSGACIDPLVIHDPHTQSYELLFQPNGLTGSVYYFESLFSTLCN